MTEIYQKLAKHLDNLPAGFPPTESGVELRILQRLFTPEEAETACGLMMFPEPVSGIAARTGQDEEALGKMLDNMSKKGLIFRQSKNNEKKYMAAQFVVGIWEYHLNDLDEELIRDVNEYLPILMEERMLKQKTKQLRVVPVSQSIRAEMNIMPYEAAEEIIRNQSKILLAPCICRREQKMVGKGCDRLSEACLVFGSGAVFYEENKLGRPISQEEALDVLKAGLEDGLVLQPGNAQKPANICMCCGCCCQILKNLKNMDNPAAVINSNYYAVTDADSCTACGECAERCQMEAITVEDSAQITAERCIGCGLCVTHCPTGAIRLQQKDREEQYTPPKNLVETYMNMARERGLI
ncbi:MAG: 4Fe-4S dicluster domain-containing protein [Desulfococcaceae bacterium]|jgi:ferredoxin|nr:4Fe-4S dicluster domain-containing protein [Desulfococcaceae bacterium]